MDMDAALIREVRRRPLLYDPGNFDYKSLKEKDKAWKEIASNLNMSVNNCKRRWKGLRDTYNRWKKLMQVTKKIDRKNPRRRWRYSAEMMFLDYACLFKDDSVISLEDGEALNLFKEQDSSEMFSSRSQDSQEQEREVTEEWNKERKFEDVLIDEMIESCTTVVNRKNQQDSTELHFASLAANIREANFPMSICNQIEAEVSKLVFSEIEKYENFLSKESEFYES